MNKKSKENCWNCIHRTELKNETMITLQKCLVDKKEKKEQIIFLPKKCQYYKGI
jgi:hypothetical protein